MVQVQGLEHFEELSASYIRLADRIGNAADGFSNIAESLTTGVQSLFKTYGRIEQIMEISTSVCSLVTFMESNEKMNIIYALPALWSLYKLIKFMLGFLPCAQEEEKEDYFDASELISEVNDVVTSMSYAALINLLPKSVQNVLATFAKFSRIRLLDDLNWLGEIAVAILSIPGYVLMTLRKGMEVLNFGNKLDTVIEVLHQAEVGYMRCINFLPAMQLQTTQNELNTVVQETATNQKLLYSAEHLVAMEDVMARVTSVMLTMTEMQTTIPILFSQQKVRLEGFIRASKVLCDTSRPEPVAIVFYSQPGHGKTYFMQQVKHAMEKHPSNTCYDYRPVNTTKDFHDQYYGQTGWFHEDLAQGGSQEWSQYIHHISNAKSPLDAAQAELKQTKFFNSRFIFATTNVALHVNGVLRPEPNCGWKFPDAIKRRWYVVDMDKYNWEDHENTKMLPVYKFDYKKTHEYHQCATIEATAQSVLDFASDQLTVNDRVYREMMKTVDNNQVVVRDYNIIAEGRKIVAPSKEEPVFVAPVQEATSVDVIYVNPIRVIKESGTYESVSAKIIGSGLLINGKYDIVRAGKMVVTTTIEEWVHYKYVEEETYIVRIINQCKEFFSTFRDEWARVCDIVSDYKAVGVLIAIAGTIITGMCIRRYLRSTPDVLATVIHQQSYPVRKKQSASRLFAEGLQDIAYTGDPNETITGIRKHVLYIETTSGARVNRAFGTVLDHQHLMMPLHTIVDENDSLRDEMFVRGMDDLGRVRIEAYYVVVEYNVYEDWVVIRRKAASQPQFSSIHSLYKKVPTSTELYLVTPYGSVFIGEPQRTDVIGVYHRFRMGNAELGDNSIRYDLHAAGLCGALLVTKCGYIFGWHVATSRSTNLGYARPIVQKVRNFIETLPMTFSNVRIDMKRDDILGAVPIRGCYKRVADTSTIEPSMMYQYNMETPELLRQDGKPYRVPADMKTPVESGDVYDVQRMKNLKVPTGIVNQNHMKVVRSYIKHLVHNRIMKGEPIRKLTEDEIVHGTQGKTRLKGVNKEASAGIPFGGLVGDCIVDGKIREDVYSLMCEIEDKAGKFIKTHDVIFGDSMKDELRDYTKQHKPRIFAAGPVHYTMLVRKYFGILCVRAMEVRHEIGIMIGMNATSVEWQRMYNRLRILKNVFDGDYKEWDGGMKKEFQEVLNEVMSSCSEDPKVSSVILSFLSETLHAGRDLNYLTSHSVPSGHGLTSLYNSLINKMYQFYAWMEIIGQNLGVVSHATLISTFERQIYGPVYGDDVAVGVHDEIAKVFNAMSYAKVMDDLGLGFTNAQKEKPTVPFQPLSEITFLKRHFYFHDKIKQVVGPLDIQVLCTMTTFTHDITRDNEIARAKMDSLQRELFLHPYPVYIKLWRLLCDNYEKAYEMDAPQLIEEHMIEMYTQGEYNIGELFID
jgi:hypothetical protein